MTYEAPTSDTPPIDLGNRGLRFWHETLERFELRPDEIAILAATCRQLDDVARLETALRDAPTLVRTRGGAEVPNPVFREVRGARLAASRLMAQLRLADAEGSTSSASAAGAALVRQRRDRQHLPARLEVLRDG